MPGLVDHPHRPAAEDRENLVARHLRERRLLLVDLRPRPVIGRANQSLLRRRFPENRPDQLCVFRKARDEIVYEELGTRGRVGYLQLQQLAQ